MITYRMALAGLGFSGLGTPIISDVFTTTGVEMGDAAPLTWKRNLNAPGSVSFSLPIDSTGVTPANFAVGKREIHLYRNGGAGEQLVFGGFLWAADVQDWFVRFSATGWFGKFRRRLVHTDFAWFNADRHDIAWDLIAYTQALTDGNMGITRFSSTPSGVVEKELIICAEEMQPIADQIQEFADADNGFDFDITPNKVFRIWSPRRGTDLSATVVFDTTRYGNVQNLSYIVDATDMSSDVYGVGEVDDCEPITFFTQADATVRTAVGRLEESYQRSDISDDLLEAQTREELRISKEARFGLTIEVPTDIPGAPVYGTYDLGDIVRLIATRGFATIDQHFRIISISYDVHRPGREVVSVELSSVIA